MHIGIAAPFLTHPFAPLLSLNHAKVPKGLGGTSIVQLVQGLIKKGFKLSIYSLDPSTDCIRTFRGDQITLSYGPYRQRHMMRDFMKIERQAVRAMIEQDLPDIVHAHWTYEYALGALSTNIPTLITVRDWAPTVLRYSCNLYRLGRLAMNITTLRRGAHFSAVSPYIKTCLERYLKQDIPVVPNFLQEAAFLLPERNPNLDAPVIASMSGGFGRLKNVKVLLRAFKIIRKELPTAKLLLYGDDFGPHGSCESWAMRKGLVDGVCFKGHVPHDEVLKELEMIDLMIHPSLEESFGMSILEGMAKRVPVIAGKESGAVPWLLGFGEAGVLVDVQSPNAIAIGALEILTNKSKWIAISQNGFRRARSSFNMTDGIAEYVKLYKSFIR
ncbi:MAG: glycosyltransferase family 4 protein [Bacteroidota bacterium]